MDYWSVCPCDSDGSYAPGSRPMLASAGAGPAKPGHPSHQGLPHQQGHLGGGGKDLPRARQQGRHSPEAADGDPTRHQACTWSSTDLAGLTCRNKNRAFPKLLYSLQAASQCHFCIEGLIWKSKKVRMVVTSCFYSDNDFFAFMKLNCWNCHRQWHRAAKLIIFCLNRLIIFDLWVN